MFANIIIRSIGVEELETLEAGKGHALLIFTPTDTPRFEQISNTRDIGRDLVQVVVVHPEVVSSSGSHIIRLRRMCDCVIVCQQDALLGKSTEVCLKKRKEDC